MSEPTYRVELTHHPENGLAVEWRGAVYLASDYDEPESNYAIFDAYRATREDAFVAAQAWCKAKAQEPEAKSTVLLTEDGDILDPHDSQPKEQVRCGRCEGMGTVRDPLYKDPIECGTCGGTGAVAS